MNEPPNSPPPPPDPDSEPQDANPPAPDEHAPAAAEGAGPPPEAVPAPAVTEPWAAQPPPGPAPGIEFGGFWIRFAAYIIDGLILGVVGIILGVAVGLVAGLSGSSAAAVQGVLYLVSFVIGIAYFTGFWVRGGSTPGMSLLGLQVVRDSDGGPISWGKALLRYVGIVISTIALFIGLIWVAFDSRKRGWHDLMAGTVVIRKPDVHITGGRKALMIGAIGCGCLLPILAIGSIVALLFMGPIVQNIFGDVANDLARGPDGQIEQPILLGFASLREGDCFELVDPEAPSVEIVRGLPCSSEHVYEVFFVGDMPDGAFPGDEAVSTFANENCLPAFEDYVGVPFEQSIWYGTPVGPTEETWGAGDRRVACLLHNQTESSVSGSVRGSEQ